jgi:hypothetical protein
MRALAATGPGPRGACVNPKRMRRLVTPVIGHHPRAVRRRPARSRLPRPASGCGTRAICPNVSALPFPGDPTVLLDQGE